MNEHVSVGTRVYHQSYGEGMINRVKKNEYEVVFINGTRSIFPINGNELTILSNLMNVKPNVHKIQAVPKPITPTEVFIPEEKVAETIIESPKVEVKTPAVEVVSNDAKVNINNVTIGLRVKHNEYGEGMINKITETQYEVIFIDGKKVKFMKNENELAALTNVPMPSFAVKTEKKEVSNYKLSFKHKIKSVEPQNIAVEQPTVATEVKEEIIEPVITESIVEEKKEFEIGVRVNHQILGEGMINKITDKFYEVIFLDGKKSKYLKTDTNLSLKVDEVKIPVQKTVEVLIPEAIKVEEEKIVEPIQENIPIETEQTKDEIQQQDIPQGIVATYVSIGSRIYHKVKGEGMIGKIKNDEFEIIFLDGTKATFFANDANLSLIGATGAGTSPNNNPESNPASSQAINKPENIKPVITQQTNLSLGSKWVGGTLILKPANSSLQKKEYTIDSFFQIILSIRNRIASLEDIITNNTNISQKEKQEIQLQIKSINRSLVAFNMLFKDKEDYFVEKE